MASAASTSYTPLGVTFDVIVVMIGIAISSDLGHIPRRTRAIMRLARVRTVEQGGFAALTRIFLFPVAASFLVVRVSAFVALVGGGIVARITGPH